MFKKVIISFLPLVAAIVAIFTLPVDSYVAAWFGSHVVVQGQVETSSEQVVPDITANSAIQIPWYRSCLSNDEQAIYDAIEKGVRDLSEDVSVPNTDPATIERCFMFVLFDNPDIFYVDASYIPYKFDRMGYIAILTPQYIFTRSKYMA